MERNQNFVLTFCRYQSADPVFPSAAVRRIQKRLWGRWVQSLTKTVPLHEGTCGLQLLITIPASASEFKFSITKLKNRNAKHQTLFNGHFLEG